MKKIFSLIILLFIFLITACTSNGADTSDEFTSGEVAVGAGASSGNGNGNGNGSQAESGLITAAEWNDLQHWDYWNDLFQKDDFKEMPSYWKLYAKHRIAVQISNNNLAVNNVPVALYRDDVLIWESKTDNLGRAELWAGFFQKENDIDWRNFQLTVNGIKQSITLKSFENGVNQIQVSAVAPVSNKAEIAFVVDATGSMSDELEFLKEDLKSVISQSKANNPIDIYTATVFYRDQGDAYVTRHSAFESNINATTAFINKQSAGGGGDYPEAVHSALEVALSELQWSTDAKTRIAFLLLDAPPHHQPNVLQSLQSSIDEAATKGIKIIPITASGIDKKTEFLMRFMAIATNGTYVFITNDSGIGNDHIQASVGDYQVEKLNELLVRLITKYTK